MGCLTIGVKVWGIEYTVASWLMSGYFQPIFVTDYIARKTLIKMFLDNFIETPLHPRFVLPDGQQRLVCSFHDLCSKLRLQAP